MSHKLNKQDIFDFFRDKSFIEDLDEDTFLIEETKNEEKEKNPLRYLIITSFNQNSKYWVLDTESSAFQLQGNKVEKILLEETQEGILNIIMIEMKSTNVKPEKIKNKFKNSLSFVYILLHLLEGKSNQNINIFGILVAQKEMNWHHRENLNIFSSTSIRYTKRSFYTEASHLSIAFEDLIKSPPIRHKK